MRAVGWLLIAALLVPGCGGEGAAAPAGSADYAAAYDRFWSDFDRTYSYFVYKNVDWSAGRDSLRAAAGVVRSDSELVGVLRTAVQPLRDVHVWFTRPDGSGVPSYTPERGPNWQLDIWRAYLPQLSYRDGVRGWGTGRLQDVGYMMISGWLTSNVSIDDLDRALEGFRDARALVIDVRMNGGGNDGLALQLAGRFASSAVRFGAVRFRNGPGHSDFGAWSDRVLSPRGSWQFTRPVYLLVGPACFSSNETFIAAMKELPNVMVGGDVTGGSSGNPKQFELQVRGRSTGWKYSVPQWQERLADGTMIEWNGIQPDSVVPYPAAAVAAGRDPVLEWAFARAGAPLRR